uniref:Uncharacterized protein n=1 Tax=Panagrellus redivivus TaxID=6233 RepID=A0A7E4UVF2_PANRE
MQKSPGLPRVVVAHPSESSATSSSESEEGVEKPRRQLTFAEDVIAQEEDFSTDEEAVDGEEESEGGETDTSEVAVVKYPVQPIVQPVPCQPKLPRIALTPRLTLLDSLADVPHFDLASGGDSSELLTASTTPRTDSDTAPGSEVEDCADFEPISPAATDLQSPVAVGDVVEDPPAGEVADDGKDDANDHPSLTREPSQKSVITTDGDDDWAHRHQGKHGKVSDLISRFNNGTDVSKTSTSYATYKYEYGVNRHPGRIEQNKFH